MEMKKKFQKSKKIFTSLFYIGVILICSIALVVSVSFVYFARDLPRPESFTDRVISQPTQIYDRTGEKLLYTMHGDQRREAVSLKEVPDHLINALLVAEDRSFYKHSGIDIEGIGRAILTNLKEWELVAGGSTISQQLVRSALLTKEKTFVRKYRELVLTTELERRYSKETILELYLNQISFGHNISGIETAAQSFFGKSVSELTIAESATLVAMIRSPSALSPYGDNKNALIGRRNYIISQMAQANLINKSKKQKALEVEHEFKEFTNQLQAPHFVMEVKNKLENTYGKEYLNQKKLNVYTTIDYNLQKKAESIAKLFAEKNRSQYNAYNMAIVIIDPNTGDILAMVGSADYYGDKRPSDCIPGNTCLFAPYTNVATKQRQPGSAFKPFVYAKAFQKGYSSETTVMDKKTNFGTSSDPYIPKNYDNRFRGEVTLREALAQSLNVPSVKVLDDMAGLQDSIELAEKFGITTFTKDPYHYGLSLVLGGGGVKLLELTSAYGVFANQGVKHSASYINKIIDAEDNTVIHKNTSTPRRVISSSIAKEITDILSDNEARAPMFGEDSSLHFENADIAVKTGSTQDYRDGWAIGYNSDIAIGVWAGNNNNASMTSLSLNVAAPAWRVLMKDFIAN